MYNHVEHGKSDNAGAYGCATTITTTEAATSSVPGPSDLPPNYTVVDPCVTSFKIHDTLIYTEDGPAYQLSCHLDAGVSRLRIRGLRASEIERIQLADEEVPFDDTRTLYEAQILPSKEDECLVWGKGGSETLAGKLELRFVQSRWHVRHKPGDNLNVIGEILTCGVTGSWSHAFAQRWNEMEPREWKDAEGRIVAKEFPEMQKTEKIPAIMLRKNLKQTGRELLIALWAFRLWVASGRDISGHHRHD